MFQTGPVQVVGKLRRLKERHLRMTVRQGSRRFQAVAWRGAEHEAVFEQHRESLDLAFSLGQNSYQGQAFLELDVADARAH